MVWNAYSTESTRAPIISKAAETVVAPSPPLIFSILSSSDILVASSPAAITGKKRVSTKEVSRAAEKPFAASETAARNNMFFNEKKSRSETKKPHSAIDAAPFTDSKPSRTVA